MDYLVEVIKIVDGATNSNFNKVVSYTKLLVEKLKKNGDLTAAKVLEDTLKKSKGPRLNAVSLSELQKIPLDSESKLALGDMETFTDGDVKVFFEKDIHKASDDFISFTKMSDQLLSSGVTFLPSLLLYGPPGCGKTELARYISSKLELPLVTARLDSLTSSFLGSTAKNIRNLFSFASSNPCVLFLDEFDAIAKLRDDVHELGELKRVVVSLLQNIDRLDKDTVLIAATNHEHLLDPAIWRRFTFKVQLGKPATETRTQLFEYFLNGFNASFNSASLAKLTNGFSGAEISDICESAKREAVISGEKTLQFSVIINSIMNVLKRRDGKLRLTVEEEVKLLRSTSKKDFTYDKISELLGISTGKISRILNEETR